jgi:indolepyruvate ferredoxin oxidoreductase
MPKHAVTLDDKYALDETRQLLTGTQAIVRLMLTQRARDVKARLNTAGYVTGYRGSPIASLEAAMLRAKGILEPHHIKFWPASTRTLWPRRCGARSRLS